MFAFFEANAGTMTLGKIVNKYNNPIVGASILVKQNNKDIMTIKVKNDGTFKDRFYPGSYVLIISAPLYNTKVMHIVVPKKDPYNLGNIKLDDSTLKLEKYNINTLCYEFKVRGVIHSLYKCSYKITGVNYSTSGIFTDSFIECFPTNKKYDRSYKITVTIKDLNNNVIRTLKETVSIKKVTDLTVQVAQVGKAIDTGKSYLIQFSVSAGPNDAVQRIHFRRNDNVDEGRYYYPGNKGYYHGLWFPQYAGIHRFYKSIKKKIIFNELPMHITAYDKSGSKTKTYIFRPKYKYATKQQLKSEATIVLDDKDAMNELSEMYSFIDDSKTGIYENDTDVMKNFDKIVDSKILVHPTLVKDMVYIKSEENKLNMVEIYDINGKLIQKTPCDTNSLELNLSRFKKAVYVMKIKDINGKCVTNKIIKN